MRLEGPTRNSNTSNLDCYRRTPCQNGGTCERSKLNSELRCDCLIGYNGLLCQVDFNECEQVNSPCDRVAYCVNTPGSYTCTCADGYTGDGFECKASVIAQGICLNEECKNNGVCKRDPKIPEGFRCECQLGFYGRYCQQDLIECDRKPCKNNRVCISTSTGYLCLCGTKYTGKHCEMAVQQEISEPATTKTPLEVNISTILIGSFATVLVLTLILGIFFCLISKRKKLLREYERISVRGEMREVQQLSWCYVAGTMCPCCAKADRKIMDNDRHSNLDRAGLSQPLISDSLRESLEQRKHEYLPRMNRRLNGDKFKNNTRYSQLSKDDQHVPCANTDKYKSTMGKREYRQLLAGQCDLIEDDRSTFGSKGYTFAKERQMKEINE